jgi:hypothetical protein
MNPDVPDLQAQELFVEICQVAADRMNSGKDISAWEAHTLGKITGICARYPGALAAWHAADNPPSLLPSAAPNDPSPAPPGTPRRS